MTAPKFLAKSELARYVEEANRMKGNRTAVATFIEEPPDDSSKYYLSVNSLELESLEQIAGYYRDRFQNGSGQVAVCAIKVFTYNEAAKKAGVDVRYDHESSSWRFSDRGGKEAAAYTYHPLLSSRDLKSASHCGVDFVRVLKEHAKSKFARRLGGGRFHLFTRNRKP